MNEEEEVDLIDEFDMKKEDTGEINIPKPLTHSSSLYPSLLLPQESIQTPKEQNESRGFSHHESMPSRPLYPTLGVAEATASFKEAVSYPSLHSSPNGAPTPSPAMAPTMPPAFSDPTPIQPLQPLGSPQKTAPPSTTWIPKEDQALHYPSSTSPPIPTADVRTNQPIQGQVQEKAEQKEMVMSMNELETKQHEIEKEIVDYERRFDYLANALAGKTQHQQEERIQREKERQERDQRRHLALENRLQQQLERDQERQRRRQAHYQHEHQEKDADDV